MKSSIRKTKEKEDLTILTHPNPMLGKKAGKIKDPLSSDIQDLIPRMLVAMKKNNGLGLAAPQIGKSIRLCIIEDEGKIHVLINPKIKSKSRSKIITEEGCLSFPGMFIPVERHEKVKVRYLDENGKKSKLKAMGLLSRALQHEIDHLDGVLFTSRKK